MSVFCYQEIESSDSMVEDPHVSSSVVSGDQSIFLFRRIWRDHCYSADVH